MKSFVLHGPFNPGFKRFKSEEFGNDCLVFYPVNKSVQTKPVACYRDLKVYMEGTKATG